CTAKGGSLLWVGQERAHGVGESCRRLGEQHLLALLYRYALGTHRRGYDCALHCHSLQHLEAHAASHPHRHYIDRRLGYPRSRVFHSAWDGDAGHARQRLHLGSRVTPDYKELRFGAFYPYERPDFLCKPDNRVYVRPEIHAAVEDQRAFGERDALAQVVCG